MKENGVTGSQWIGVALLTVLGVALLRLVTGGWRETLIGLVVLAGLAAAFGAFVVGVSLVMGDVTL